MIRFTLSVLSAFLLVLSVSSVSQAKGTVKVGDVIPHDLSAKDQTGKMRHFNDLKGKKGITLVFIRSVEWCPFCQKQILELSKNAKKFSDSGYPVVTVSYDALPQIEKFVTTNKPKITLLSDPASEIIRAFGILNKNSAKGTMSYGIPYPGTYIISKDKKVQAKFFNEGYKDRVSVDTLLAEIKKLNPPPAPNYLSLDEMGSDPIDPENSVINIPEKITTPVTLPEDGLKAPVLDTPEAPAVEKIAPAPEVIKVPGVSKPELMAPKEFTVPELPASDIPAGPVPVM